MRKLEILAVVLLLSVRLLSACAAAPTLGTTALPEVTPEPSTIPTVTPAPGTPAGAARPDHEIDAAAVNGQTITVKAGDILRVLPPDPDREWQVDFAADILSPLTEPEKMARPGAEGWLFRAAAAGESELRLTTIVHCEGTVPCPQMPMLFSITILVR